MIRTGRISLATTGGATLTKRLLLLAGQSNPQGPALVSGNTNYPGISTPFAAVQHYEECASLTDPPIFHAEGPRDTGPRTIGFGTTYVAGTAGPEITAAHELATRPNETWFTAKETIASSGLQNNWIPTSGYPTVGTSLYLQHEAFITARIAAFGITDVPNNLFYYWNQGEADAGEQPDSANYLTNLTDFFAALRATFGEFYIILNRLTSNFAGSTVIRTAQESFAAVTTKCRLVYIDDLAMADTAHFTADSYATMGIRIKLAVDALIANAARTSPYWLAGGVPQTLTSAQGGTPVFPAHAADDIIVFWVSGIGQNAYTLSSANGFVAITGSPQHDSGSAANARVQAWWCRATSSAQAAPVMADAASDNAKVIGSFVIRGCATTGDPFDTGAGGTAASGTAASLPTLTTLGTNRLIVHMLGHLVVSAAASVSGWTNTALTDLTEHYDTATLSGLGGGMGIATGIMPGVDTIGTTTATLASAATKAMLTIAFKP